MLSDSLYQGFPDQTLAQALKELAKAQAYIERLERKDRTLERHLAEHMERAQLLSDALAAERAARLALQARVAELERQMEQVQTERMTRQAILERTAGTQ